MAAINTTGMTTAKTIINVREPGPAAFFYSYSGVNGVNVDPSVLKIWWLTEYESKGPPTFTELLLNPDCNL